MTTSVATTDLATSEAGHEGSAVLLVHGFPESRHAFDGVLPLLAESHRVVSVDLRGFGDSPTAPADFTSGAAARDLHELVEHLDLGPVHLLAQDVSGGAAFRLAAGRPDLVRSFTGVETGLAGFGLEALADVTNGGSWHIGALTAPGVPDLLLRGREADFLRAWFATMTADPGAVGEEDVVRLARAFARPSGWNGAVGLYASMLAEGAELRALAAETPLTMPVLAIGGGGGDFTATTLDAVSAAPVARARVEGVGHHVAMEAPEALATTVGEFLASVDAG